jgi:hypothetical protein
LRPVFLVAVVVVVVVIVTVIVVGGGGCAHRNVPLVGRRARLGALGVVSV